ncbi:MAG TPA: hypothetical protein VNF49_07550 [Candidatus Binataceae bacterium]|nr:hypothetical protein [Candidatus Binataceae bacterium]
MTRRARMLTAVLFVALLAADLYFIWSGLFRRAMQQFPFLVRPPQALEGDPLIVVWALLTYLWGKNAKHGILISIVIASGLHGAAIYLLWREPQLIGVLQYVIVGLGTFAALQLVRNVFVRESVRAV